MTDEGLGLGRGCRGRFEMRGRMSGGGIEGI